jgi:hypothetical protein
MTYIAIATLAAALVTTAPAAMANSWTWARVSNGATLDAHLARADFARPNTLPVFAMIEDIATPEAAY